MSVCCVCGVWGTPRQKQPRNKQNNRLRDVCERSLLEQQLCRLVRSPNKIKTPRKRVPDGTPEAPNSNWAGGSWLFSKAYGASSLPCALQGQDTKDNMVTRQWEQRMGTSSPKGDNARMSERERRGAHGIEETEAGELRPEPDGRQGRRGSRVPQVHEMSVRRMGKKTKRNKNRRQDFQQMFTNAQKLCN